MIGYLTVCRVYILSLYKRIVYGLFQVSRGSAMDRVETVTDWRRIGLRGRRKLADMIGFKKGYKYDGLGVIYFIIYYTAIGGYGQSFAR